MDYQTTLEHLYRLERFGIKLGLDNIRRLLSLLGDPQRGLKVLHVTGTNGKGSVCAYAASVLRAAGYRVGRWLGAQPAQQLATGPGGTHGPAPPPRDRRHGATRRSRGSTAAFVEFRTSSSALG